VTFRSQRPVQWLHSRWLRHRTRPGLRYSCSGGPSQAELDYMARQPQRPNDHIHGTSTFGYHKMESSKIVSSSSLRDNEHSTTRPIPSGPYGSKYTSLERIRLENGQPPIFSTLLTTSTPSQSHQSLRQANISLGTRCKQISC
jgi:hypothetical protein